LVQVSTIVGRWRIAIVVPARKQKKRRVNINSPAEGGGILHSSPTATLAL
jgi:hypothetical protein